MCDHVLHWDQHPALQQVVNATVMFNELIVQNTTAAASLTLSNVESIIVDHDPVPTNNSVIDGLKKNGSCTAYVGNASMPLDIRIGANAENSSLLVECPQASELLLDNQGGACLAAVMPSTTFISVEGDAAVAVVINTNQTIPVVDVSNMTAGGQLILYLTNGTALSGSSSQGVQGTLPFPLPDGQYAVVVRGCQPQRMPCTVLDAAGRDVCIYDRTPCVGAVANKVSSLCAIA